MDGELEVVVCSTQLDATPQGMYLVDRLQGFNRGYGGDIELYNDPALLLIRNIRQRTEDAILFGSGTSEGFANLVNTDEVT